MPQLNEIHSIRRKFTFENIEFRIVYRWEKEKKSSELSRVTRVITPNGKSIPVTKRKSLTLREIEARTIEAVNKAKEKGVDILKACTDGKKIADPPAICKGKTLSFDDFEVKYKTISTASNYDVSLQIFKKKKLLCGTIVKRGTAEKEMLETAINLINNKNQ